MSVIAIKNWDRHQHYKDRDPPWVKLYRDILTSESWVLGTDVSRVVQVASILLAARYGNQIPRSWKVLKKVTNLDCSEQAFETALTHLRETNFLEIQASTSDQKSVAQDASKSLAKCSSEAEQSRAEKRQSREEEPVPQSGTDVPRETKPESSERVFEHWRQTHQHPKAALDGKRRKVILEALKHYDEADLCQAISGYLHSPHHRGQNANGTVYDDITLMLRDSTHIDAGLRFYAQPPQAKTKAHQVQDANVSAGLQFLRSAQ